jgi:hypothetical protein
MADEFSDGEYDSPEPEPTEKWIYEMYRDRYKPLSMKGADGVMMCVRKVKVGNKYNKYKKCKTPLIRCHWCWLDLCPQKECISQYAIRSYVSVSPSRKHESCLECDKVTCCPTGICDDCEQRHFYDMITDRVAIGSYRAPYEPFDIVVNLDYPDNNVKKGQIVCSTHNNIYLIECGFADMAEGGLTRPVLDEIMSRIEEFGKPNPKILFHCYAGVSRSVTVAIEYLSKKENKTPQEIYKLVQQKRPRVNPNPEFRKLIGI